MLCSVLISNSVSLKSEQGRFCKWIYLLQKPTYACKNDPGVTTIARQVANQMRTLKKVESYKTPWKSQNCTEFLNLSKEAFTLTQTDTDIDTETDIACIELSGGVDTVPRHG